jgi:translation initiation factor 2 subunit 1
VIVTLDESSLKGNIIFAEISPGRIRNIREFVSIGKKIVCKVIRKKEDHIELSLRRVTAKERDIVLDKYKKERILSSMLKPITVDKTQEIVEKIKEDNSDTYDIVEKIKENPYNFKKYFTSTQLEQLKKIAVEKSEKEKTAQAKISIKSDSESGILQIKESLESKDADISYLGSGQFLIRTKAKDYKTANSELDKTIQTIKEKAKAKHIHFEVK